MLILLLTLLGFFVGSFLLVVADRFGTDRSFLVGRSSCDHCHTVLGVLDLIPVVSFVLSMGKCRHCRKQLSWRYPLIEIATACLFGLTAWRLNFLILQPIGFTPAHFSLFLFRDLLFVSLLLVLFLVDARRGILPDQMTIPGILIIFLLNLWLGIPVGSMLIGALVVGGFFALQYVLSHGTWVGDGDIRLGALLGVMFGLAQGVFVLLFAYIIGAAFALVLLWKKKAGMKSVLAFGPFLAIAGFIVLFFGPYLVQRFFSF